MTTGDAHEPYQVVGPGGEVVEPVSVFLRDLLASGKSAGTLRSYSVDLLRWWRFLDAVDVQWDRASRAEARDFSMRARSYHASPGEITSVGGCAQDSSMNCAYTPDRGAVPGDVRGETLAAPPPVTRTDAA